MFRRLHLPLCLPRCHASSAPGALCNLRAIITPLEVRRGDGLYLGITEKPNHFTYDKEPPLKWVREVRFDSPVERDGVSWVAVPWSGKLEFWLSRQQASVYHTER